MSTLTSSCPYCGQYIETDEEYAGLVSCPACHMTFTVPALPNIKKAPRKSKNKRVYSKKHKTSFILNGKQCFSFDEIKEKLNLCQQQSIVRVTLSYGEGSFLSVTRKNEQYKLEWISNGEIAQSVSKNLTFKKVVELFQGYYSKSNLRTAIRWQFIIKKNQNEQSFKDYDPPLANGGYYKNLPQQYKRRSKEWDTFLSGLGITGIVILFICGVVCFGLVANSCDQKKESSLESSSPSSWKRSNDPRDWRAEEVKLENQTGLKNAAYSCRRCGMKSYTPLNDGVNGINGVCAYCIDYLRNKR